MIGSPMRNVTSCSSSVTPSIVAGESGDDDPRKGGLYGSDLDAAGGEERGVSAGLATRNRPVRGMRRPIVAHYRRDMFRMMFVLMAATIGLVVASPVEAAQKPSAFVAGFQFCQAFDTKTLALRFDTKPTKAAVSRQVGRWFTWQIPHDHAAYRYPVRYQRIIAMGCTRGL